MSHTRSDDLRDRILSLHQRQDALDGGFGWAPTEGERYLAGLMRQEILRLEEKLEGMTMNERGMRMTEEWEEMDL